jgi:arylsulfatase A-like enzyme/DUF1680 family protein
MKARLHNPVKPDRLVVWNPPPGTPVNTTYSVQVRLHGQKEWKDLFVYNIKVGHQKGPRTDASMVNFNFSGTVDLKVIYNRGEIQSLDIRPHSYGIQANRRKDTLLFSLSQNEPAPRKLVLRVNNDWEALCLHIVTNPPEEKAPTPSDPSVYVVHPGDEIPFILPKGKNTYYFMPGVHSLPQGLWVELDLGAVYPVDRIALEQGRFRGGFYPQKFQVETKLSLREDYSVAYDGTGNTDTGYTEKRFPPKNTRYVRLLLLGSNVDHGFFLSNVVREFKVFAGDKSPNLALHHAIAGAMPGFQKAVDGSSLEYASVSGYGNWHAGESFFVARDSTTLYIAPGAVVKGAICADGINHITIKGSGILDCSGLRHARGKDNRGGVLTGAVWLTSGKDNLVEGITILDPPLWSVVMNFSERPTVRNIDLFGSVVNADGIHMSGSSHGLVDGVFIRTPDDHILIYHYGPASFITVKNSVFWGDDAHIFLIGLGTAPHADIHDIDIENCDVLNQQGVYNIERFTGVMALWPNGGNEIRKVIFKDIRIDSFRDPVKGAVFQLRTDERLPGEGQGTIRNVLFQNIAYNGHGEQKSLLYGARENSDIQNVHFEDYYREGARVKDTATGNIRESGYVSKIYFAETREKRQARQEHPSAWRFEGHIGQYIDRIAKNRLLDSNNWNRIYPETERAFRLRQDDISQPGKGLWRGEFWGKYLLSAIAASQYFHAAELKTRISLAVKGLLGTQDSDGYIGTYTNASFVTGSNWNVWCRKYTLWALIEAWQILGDDKILHSASRFADQLIRQVGPGSVDITKTGMFYGLPSSSILLPMVKLYQATGESKYLDYAMYIVRQWSVQPGGLPDILNKGLTGKAVNNWFPGTDSYQWAKGYEFISCVEGIVALYNVTGKTVYLQAAENIYESLLQHERTPVGSVSFDDKLVGSAGLINTVSEICDVVYWNRLSFALFKATGKEKYIAEMERSLYNALLCAYNQEGTWGLRRLRMSHQHIPAHNHFLQYHQCCVDNLPRGLFQAGEAVLTNIKGDVYFSLFAPGEGEVALASGSQLHVKTSGDFLATSAVTTTLTMARPEKFTFMIRMPAWSKKTIVKVNNIILKRTATGGWMAISREWKSGDSLKISFEIGLRWETFDPSKLDTSYHTINFYNAVWANMKFMPATNPSVNRRYKHVTALHPEDALPQRPAVTFFYGPLALARDIRVTGPDVFFPIAAPGECRDLSIHAAKMTQGIWKTFLLNLGKNSRVRFCDFSSAGNTWNKDSEFNTWCLLKHVEGRTHPALGHPNVIIINMDDMGYGDTEPYGMTDIATPNFNRLAREGMRFTHFEAAQPVCSPSRAALLTGCYPNRIGISGSALSPWDKRALNPSEETIASLVKMIGYKTAMLGKWHLGSHPPFLPIHYGFDSFYGLPYSHDMWPVDYAGNPVTDTSNGMYKYPPLPILDGDKQVAVNATLQDQGRLTSTLTRKAVAFISANKSNPFFLYLAHPMPHVPLAASAGFKGKSGHGPFGDVIMELDWSIGQVLDVLDKEGLSGNTLLIVTSDNGPWLKFGDHAGSSGGLREGKMVVMEGGVRVPCFIRWPGRIKAGAICSQLLTNMDLLPTIAGITGAGLPKNKIDGISFAPLLLGKTSVSPREVMFYYYGTNNLEAVRYKNWKLVLPHRSLTYSLDVHGKNGFPGKTSFINIKMALYDLIHDPAEMYDVQAQFPDIVKKLSAMAEECRNDLGDDLTNRKGRNLRPAAIAN